MRKFLLFPIAVILCGCQSTDSSHVWRRPGYFGPPKKSVSVVVLAYRPETRKEFEDAVAAELQKNGVVAHTTHATLPTQSVISDKAAALGSIKDADGVLVARLADPSTLKAVKVAPQNSGETMQPWQNWFDFFTAPKAFAVGPVGMSPGGEAGVQAVLYESPSGQLLWSEAVVIRRGASLVTPQSFSTAVVAGLKKSAVIK